jgi:very-short-patch-repair endonuclease
MQIYRMLNIEDTFLFHLAVSGLPAPVREYKFCLTRRWRVDFAWPDLVKDGQWAREKIIVEIEGGTTTNGRHNRSAGYEKDCEKYNAATLAGWKVYRFTSAMVSSGKALAFMESVLR